MAKKRRGPMSPAQKAASERNWNKRLVGGMLGQCKNLQSSSTMNPTEKHVLKGIQGKLEYLINHWTGK